MTVTTMSPENVIKNKENAEKVLATDFSRGSINEHALRRVVDFCGFDSPESAIEEISNWDIRPRKLAAQHLATNAGRQGSITEKERLARISTEEITISKPKPALSPQPDGTLGEKKSGTMKSLDGVGIHNQSRFLVCDKNSYGDGGEQTNQRDELTVYYPQWIIEKFVPVYAQEVFLLTCRDECIEDWRGRLRTYLDGKVFKDGVEIHLLTIEEAHRLLEGRIQ